MLGNSTILEETIVQEVHAADTVLDYFDVLWYNGGVGPKQGAHMCGNEDPNLSYCLDTGLAWMLNSTRVWQNVTRMSFFITYSNDIDRGSTSKGMFTNASGTALWESYVGTWVRAMQHEHYLRVNNRPVFKVLIPEVFVTWQCNGNATLANALLKVFKASAIAAGVGEPLIGGGWLNPSVPSVVPAPTPRPHPKGYMLYNSTDVACSGGCTITQLTVSSIEQCQFACNSTAGCTAITISHSSPLLCKLKSSDGPGTPSGSVDTMVRVAGNVHYDFGGTYNAAPPVCPGQPNWQCPRYKNSWFPNATKSGAKVFPYTECSAYQAAARGNHSNDTVPYVASLIAGFDPRPWEEPSPSFEAPTQGEWRAAVQQVVHAVQVAPFGFPDVSSPSGVQPAFTIYAWNEYGEGGILAPSKGQGWMKLQTLAQALNR